MALITESGPDTIAIGSAGPDFRDLPGVDGQNYSLDWFKDSQLLVINFTCNHCPYAKAYEDRFNELARTYIPQGIAFLAINSNDVETYPDDNMDRMRERAAEKAFAFPYVRDDDQSVAKAYGAVCTPHLFVLDRDRKLAYEGRIDDSWKEPDQVKSHDLREALETLLAGQPAPNPNTNPMGCSIKWK